MRRLALLLLASCASRPAPARPPPPAPPAPVVAEAADAAPPAPARWPGAIETMVPGRINTSQLYQTKTHVLWEESIEHPDETKSIEAIIAVDKKTLQQRTVHTRTMTMPTSRQEMFAQSERFRRMVYTSDDALFIESPNDTLRITLDDKVPLRFPSTEETSCVDSTSVYRIINDKSIVVAPFRPGKTAKFPLGLAKDTSVIDCRVHGDALYLFLATGDGKNEPHHAIGRVPLRGGTFEAVSDIDGPATNAASSDGAFAFRSRPNGDPFYGHVLLLEPGKPIRLIAKTTGMATTVGVNRTHVCWNDIALANQNQINCAPRAGGEPAVVVDHAGPMSAFFLLDDDHLMWLDTELRRMPVPR